MPALRGAHRCKCTRNKQHSCPHLRHVAKLGSSGIANGGSRSKRRSKRFGQPKAIEDIDRHRIITFGGTAGSFIQEINWLNTAGREPKAPREPVFEVNNLGGVKTAVEKGVGLAVLPDYLVGRESQLVQVLTDAEMPQLDTYFAYPEEKKNLARIQVFRDFLVSKAQRWAF